MRTSKMAGLAPFRCGRTFVLRSGAAVAVLSACTTISKDVPSVVFPEGKYIYTEAPLTASLDPAAGWTFEFRDEGYAFYRDQVRVFEGSYAAARDTIAFRSEEGLPWTACRDTDAGPDVYQWRQDGDRLILVALHDSCERRLLVARRSSLYRPHVLITRPSNDSLEQTAAAIARSLVQALAGATDPITA